MAFNNNGSIFFNVYHFKLTDSNEIFNWQWIITTCHELAHNVYKYHDKNFVSLFQKIIQEYVIKLNI